MRSFPAVVLAVGWALLLCAAGSMADHTPRTRLVPSGVWGGDHIRMEVTRDGAEIEFDCARGTISRPLALDAQGRFRVQGTYRADTPAPMGADGGSGAGATYSGTVRGTTLRLEVSVAGQQGARSFHLLRGQEGRLAKCA